MKARWIVVSLCLAMLFAAHGLRAENDTAGGSEFKATCPVSGKPAKETNAVAAKNGDKIYFCCQNCPKAYEAHPEKYELQARRQLLETHQIVQVACPLTGKSMNKETAVDAGQAQAAFCCKNCLAKYNAADQDARLEMIFGNAGMRKGFTHQTKCPVSGKPIDPSQSIVYEGQKVYFCCPHCPAAFEANPERFLAKLPQFSQGSESASQN